MRIHLLLIGLLCFVFGAACSSGQQKIQQKSPENKIEGALSQEEARNILINAEQYRLGDSSLFPFVYQGPGKSNIFQAYSMRFSLTYEEPLIPLLHDQVNWVDPTKFNDNNGLFITYARNGREVSLTNPYIQVQYISKSLPGASTIDSVYQWLDGIHFRADDSRQLGQTFTLPTASGKVATVKDYFTGSFQGRNPKYLAYAYLDFDENYILGMALTTSLESDYDLTKPSFHKLVKSLAVH
ncbi:MAG: hypothetical protein AAF587_34765 [Bacteroidota bacterium]